MALSKLSGDQHRSIFSQLCNVLEPRTAVALSSVSHELQEPTQALLQQLRADNAAAAALCRKMMGGGGGGEGDGGEEEMRYDYDGELYELYSREEFIAEYGGTQEWEQAERVAATDRAGMRSCKELREAKEVTCLDKKLSAADLTLLGTLGSVLPALETLYLYEPKAGPDSVQRLAERLSAGALPAVTSLTIGGMHVGDAGASALAAALGRGALPRLKILNLSYAAIGDAGLVALAPALRRLPALEHLDLGGNPLGNEGLATLVAPPPPAGAPPTTTGVLAKLKLLDLENTQVTDAGCAALAAALGSGALPALETLYLDGIPASAAAKAAVYEVRDTLVGG